MKQVNVVKKKLVKCTRLFRTSINNQDVSGLWTVYTKEAHTLTLDKLVHKDWRLTEKTNFSCSDFCVTMK